MRRVEIIEDKRQFYSWAAVDQDTHQRLLKLKDADQLRSVCERLEWQIVDIKSASQSRPEA